MFTVLHCFGNLPFKKEIFMIMVKGVLILSLNSFRIRFRIKFGATAFVVLMVPVMLIIFSLVTGCSRREVKRLFSK